MSGCLSSAPYWDLACNPGVCPDWESNWQLFGLQARAGSHFYKDLCNFVGNSWISWGVWYGRKQGDQLGSYFKHACKKGVCVYVWKVGIAMEVVRSCWIVDLFRRQSLRSLLLMDRKKSRMTPIFSAWAIRMLLSYRNIMCHIGSLKCSSCHIKKGNIFYSTHI